MTSRKWFLIGLSSLIIVGLTLGGLPMLTRAAPAVYLPSLTVSPPNGVAGSGVTLTGSGFDPGGYMGTIQWDGATQSTFTIPSGGAFSTGFSIPNGASVGNHVISVCAACGDGDVEQKASADFLVNPPIPAITDLPVVTVIPLLPSIDVPPVTIDPIIPGVCTSFDLGPEAEVVTFEYWSPGSPSRVFTGHSWVHFTPGTAFVDTPLAGARSGTRALRSTYDDFGSAGHPIVISFPVGRSAVGLYVGREELGAFEHETLFAVLTAYGYDASLNMVEIASDFVPLPAEATPIQRCVVVYAPSDQAIRSVTLDYVTEAGVSAYDRRWVDDLTFTGNITLPDAPPSVQILYPADGSSVTTDIVSIIAQIHEDISLTSVEYSLNNADFFPMRFERVVGSDPTLYEARATIPLARLRSDIPNPLLVRATDSTSHTGEDSLSFGYTPGGAGDIWITAIEVTQAVQTIDNRIPLTAYKQTAVRVYIRSTEDARGPWTGVMARMVVSGRTYFPSLVDPRVGITASPMGSDRYSTTDSFVFLLDSRHTSPGSRDLQVSISTLGGRQESNLSNNTRIQPVTFNQSLYLSIYGVTYGNLNPTLGPAPWSDFEAHRSFTRTVFPVTDFFIRPLPGNPTPTFDNSEGTAYVKAREEWAPRMLASLPRGSRLYLLQPEGDTNSGRASTAGWMNGQNVRGADAGSVMAQEAGHSFGLWWHAPGEDADIPNDAYPYGKDSIGTQVGFDTRSLLPIPRGAGDIMSYFNRVWVSPFTYCALLGVIPGAVTCPGGAERAFIPEPGTLALASLDPFADALLSKVSFDLSQRADTEQGQFLFVAGRIDPDGTATFYPFEVITSSEDLTSIPTGADYRMVLRNGSGGSLSSYDFQPLLTHMHADDPIAFSLIFPYVPDIKAVALYRGDTLLAERRASASAPQVTLLAPNNGETWSGMQTISWQAKDTDNDSLTYTVEYSADGGQTWIPLNTSLTTTSLVVDFDSIPGSDSALVRVSASDGMLTSTDVSDGTFGVPFKRPQITISQPVDGATYLERVPFLVSADAFDWEDGSISNLTSYTWSSDKDGVLGTGPWIVASTLTPGEHTLAVTVQDSSGNQSSAQVHVTIEALVTSPAVEPFHLPKWIWIAIGVLAVLAFSIIGIIWRRARR